MSCPVTQLLTSLVEAEKMAGREPPKGYHYTSIAHFVLEKAQCSCGREMTPEELRQVEGFRLSCERIWGRPKPKECFANAQKLVISGKDDRLVYTEGYATHLGSFMSVLHGWAELEGAIIDPTPVWGDPGLGVFGPGVCYHAAIRVDWREVTGRAGFRGQLSSYIDDWCYGFPLLRRK